MAVDDYFAVFGLPRKLAVDVAGLERRYYELAREHHPDFHQGADAARQADALSSSARVTRAYRALRDPLARVEYLVALEEGRETREGGVGKPRVPAALLAEMLEVQEALEETQAAGLDEEARARLRDERARLIARRTAEDAAIVARGADWDAVVDAGGDRRPLLAWFKERLAMRAYLRTVIGDLGDALGEDQDAHVPHRRH
ncbi:MAG: Fe-S protein assembly co-chaperone HscB [Candidatus Rokubacteria bacterium]|nr:Fe-S protein assembly co-chaperone HscB [Candidatus Rokubacteria bacterium]